MDWEEMFPGRFLKAADVKGDVTLTIAAVVKEELPGDGNTKKVKGLMSFREKFIPGPEKAPMKQLVLNRTNATAIKGMFGPETNGWIGKRVTFFKREVDAFGEQTPAIRVKGSPDIRQQIEFVARVGRQDRKYRLVPTAKPNGNGRAAAPAPAAEPQREDGTVPYDPPESNEELFQE